MTESPLHVCRAPSSTPVVPTPGRCGVGIAAVDLGASFRLPGIPGGRAGSTRCWAVTRPEGAVTGRWGDGAMSASASRLDRITVDPAINHGKPSIRGMRIPVQTLSELLAGGMTFDEVLADYPALEREDPLATVEFAAISRPGTSGPCPSVREVPGPRRSTPHPARCVPFEQGSRRWCCLLSSRTGTQRPILPFRSPLLKAGLSARIRTSSIRIWRVALPSICWSELATRPTMS